VEQHQVTEIVPKPLYAPKLVADRTVRFGREVLCAGPR
jgi:hypothetical protein